VGREKLEWGSVTASTALRGNAGRCPLAKTVRKRRGVSAENSVLLAGEKIKKGRMFWI